MAFATEDGFIGNSVILTPVASKIAFAMAASGGTIATSPTPLTPVSYTHLTLPTKA